VNAFASKLPAASPPAPVRETVYDLIAAWARGASRRRLTAWTAVGFAGAVPAVLFAGRWWFLGMALLAMGATGAWGLLRGESRLARMARGVAILVGTLAGIAGFFGALILVLGPSWQL